MVGGRRRGGVNDMGEEENAKGEEREREAGGLSKTLHLANYSVNDGNWLLIKPLIPMKSTALKCLCVLYTSIVTNYTPLYCT